MNQKLKKRKPKPNSIECAVCLKTATFELCLSNMMLFLRYFDPTNYINRQEPSGNMKHLHKSR